MQDKYRNMTGIGSLLLLFRDDYSSISVLVFCEPPHQGAATFIFLSDKKRN